MKKRLTQITIIAVITIFGVCSMAFAGPGQGNGCPRWNDQGGKRQQQESYRPCYKKQNNLSDEQKKALEEERTAFFNSTESIRKNLYLKDLELRTELARENPDIKKASTIQESISKLQADFDQKRLEFHIKVSKIDPNYRYGNKRKGSMGDRKHGGGGYCWR